MNSSGIYSRQTALLARPRDGGELQRTVGCSGSQWLLHRRCGCMSLLQALVLLLSLRPLRFDVHCVAGRHDAIEEGDDERSYKWTNPISSNKYNQQQRVRRQSVTALDCGHNA